MHRKLKTKTPIKNHVSIGKYLVASLGRKTRKIDKLTNWFSKTMIRSASLILILVINVNLIKSN